MLVSNSKSLSAVVNAIRKLVKVHSIYVIGHQVYKTKTCCSLHINMQRRKTTHVYTLLVISYDLVEDPHKFMNEVYNKTQRSSRIYSIHYTYNEVSFRLTEGNNFLSLVLSKAVITYQQNQNLYHLPHSILYHPTVYNKVKKAWDLRYKRAGYFFEKTTICEDITDDSSRYLLFQEVVRQTCLGLLYLFWEFQPNFFAIPFLLNLCSQFTDLPIIIYPKDSFRSKEAYHKLCHARYLMNNQPSTFQTDEYTGHIEKVVSHFLQKAEVLAEQQLVELERKHNKKKQR
ncbi:hypothetical protein E0K83_07820 [Gramella sp. BOM4]|nr:hypothetical protein [Christiangramia bathymodioli]